MLKSDDNHKLSLGNVLVIIVIMLGICAFFVNAWINCQAENNRLSTQIYYLQDKNENLQKDLDACYESKSFLPTQIVTQIYANTPKTRTIPYNIEQDYKPSGWMGDGEFGTKYITFTQTVDATKIKYSPGPQGWAGIYWQYPDSNWGEKPGFNLNGAKKITFEAKGETGSEIIEFLAGGIEGKQYEDSFKRTLGRIQLSQDWKKYEISLVGADLSNVIGAFGSSTSTAANPNGVTFYLRNIQYE